MATTVNESTVQNEAMVQPQQVVMPIPTEKNQHNDFEEEISKLIPTAGTLNMTDEQSRLLYEEIKDEEIEVRPDGLIYAPWYIYVKRLNAAFGGSHWALVPQGMPKHSKNENMVYWGFTLIINGKYVAFAIGQNEYLETNYNMKYGDCCEGAKSNALMRVCKDLGMFHKLWNHAFGEEWKKKYTEQKWHTDKQGKSKLKWTKKPLVANPLQNT